MENLEPILTSSAEDEKTEDKQAIDPIQNFADNIITKIQESSTIDQSILDDIVKLKQLVVPYQIAVSNDFRASRCKDLFMSTSEIENFLLCIALREDGKIQSFRTGFKLPNGKVWSVEQLMDFVLSTIHSDVKLEVVDYQIFAPIFQHADPSVTSDEFVGLITTFAKILADHSGESSLLSSNFSSTYIPGSISPESRKKAQQRKKKKKSNKKKR